MKKSIISTIFVLVAIVAFSTQANAQRFRVTNNTTEPIRIDYCAMSTGTLAASGVYSITSTCTTFLPCTVTLSFPGCSGPVNIPLSPCPTLGTDYVYQTGVVTGCILKPNALVNFYYDGGTNDIIITVN